MEALYKNLLLSLLERQTVFDSTPGRSVFPHTDRMRREEEDQKSQPPGEASEDTGGHGRKFTTGSFNELLLAEPKKDRLCLWTTN